VLTKSTMSSSKRESDEQILALTEKIGRVSWGGKVAGLVGKELGVMEELRECAFYRPRGGSGRQRRDGVLVREQGQRYSEEWNCRHTRDEMAKPARAAKHHGATVRSGAESCRTLMCGLIVGPECRDKHECGSRVSRAQRKGMAPRGAP